MKQNRQGQVERQFKDWVSSGGTVPQDRGSRVRLPVGSFEIFK